MYRGIISRIFKRKYERIKKQVAPYLAGLASPLRLRDSGLYKDSGEPTESGEKGRTYQYTMFKYIFGIVVQLSVQNIGFYHISQT